MTCDCCHFPIANDQTCEEPEKHPTICCSCDEFC